jgi:hypothetical protein
VAEIFKIKKFATEKLHRKGLTVMFCNRKLHREDMNVLFFEMEELTLEAWKHLLGIKSSHKKNLTAIFCNKKFNNKKPMSKYNHKSSKNNKIQQNTNSYE